MHAELLSTWIWPISPPRWKRALARRIRCAVHAIIRQQATGGPVRRRPVADLQMTRSVNTTDSFPSPKSSRLAAFSAHFPDSSGCLSQQLIDDVLREIIT